MKTNEATEQTWKAVRIFINATGEKHAPEQWHVHRAQLRDQWGKASLAVCADKATAALMAAAPELFRALKLVVNSEYDRDEESRNFEQSTLDSFESIIAKAEGKI